MLLRHLAVTLGPALGAAGLAAALRTMLRDKVVADSMQAHGLNLLGSMVAFFAHACSSVEANRPLMALFGPLFLVQNAVYGLEAGRGGARGPLRYYSLWAALMQVAGIGFVTPALWLPAYAACRAERDGTLRAVTARRAHITAGITAVLALACTALALLDVGTRSWRVVATAFQFVALLGAAYPLLSSPAADSTDAAEAARGAAAASRLYTLLAGAAAALHWVTAVALLRGGTGALRRLADDVAGNGALRFLLLDFGGLALAGLLLVASEARDVAQFATSAARGLACAALLSPAAPLALWLADREGRLAARAPGHDKAAPEGRPRRKRAPTPKVA